MKRRQTRVELDSETILHKVRVESEKDDDNSIQKEARRHIFLNTILSSPEMWMCGPGKFDEMKIFYESGGWVLETQFVERLQPSNGSRG